MKIDIAAAGAIGTLPTGLERTAERPRFTAKQCETLLAAVQSHDDVHLDARLPDDLHFNYRPEQFARGFALARQLWDGGFRRAALIRLATKVIFGRRFDPADIVEFKDIRARFKQLRFASVMFDEAHAYSPALHHITKTMGQLQDALKNGHHAKAAARAFQLRISLTGMAYRRMKRGLDQFHPSSIDGFRSYLEGELAAIRRFLAKSEITGKEFHEVRKTVSRLMAFYDCMNTLYPSFYHERIARFVSTINGLMGGLHDGLVERRLSKEQDYHAEMFPLPADIGQRLGQLERGLALSR